MIAIKKILCPIDYSEPSALCGRYAAELARRFGAELCLLHVFHAPYLDMTFGPAAGMAPDLAQARRALEHAEQEALENETKKPEYVGLPLRTEFRIGPPATEIVRAARDLQADLIVIATHGRGGMKHVLLGSVAENVVRAAPCPVLTVRQGEREFVMP